MSLLTQLLHVFLGAPLSTTPITFILVHFFTQLFSSFRSTCPNHLNLPLCILFSTHSMPKRFKSSSLRFLSFKDTPHILLTIILSALLNLARSSAFIAQVSLPYTNTLCTQASYIFPFSFKETPLFVSTGASSLNLAIMTNIYLLFYLLLLSLFTVILLLMWYYLIGMLLRYLLSQLKDWHGSISM